MKYAIPGYIRKRKSILAIHIRSQLHLRSVKRISGLCIFHDAPAIALNLPHITLEISRAFKVVQTDHIIVRKLNGHCSQIVDPLCSRTVENEISRFVPSDDDFKLYSRSGAFCGLLPGILRIGRDCLCRAQSFNLGNKEKR